MYMYTQFIIKPTVMHTYVCLNEEFVGKLLMILLTIIITNFCNFHIEVIKVFGKFHFMDLKTF